MDITFSSPLHSPPIHASQSGDDSFTISFYLSIPVTQYIQSLKEGTRIQLWTNFVGAGGDDWKEATFAPGPLFNMANADETFELVENPCSDQASSAPLAFDFASSRLVLCTGPLKRRGAGTFGFTYRLVTSHGIQWLGDFGSNGVIETVSKGLVPLEAEALRSDWFVLYQEGRFVAFASRNPSTTTIIRVVPIGDPPPDDAFRASIPLHVLQSSLHHTVPFFLILPESQTLLGSAIDEEQCSVMVPINSNGAEINLLSTESDTGSENSEWRVMLLQLEPTVSIVPLPRISSSSSSRKSAGAQGWIESPQGSLPGINRAVSDSESLDPNVRDVTSTATSLSHAVSVMLAFLVLFFQSFKVPGPPNAPQSLNDTAGDEVSPIADHKHKLATGSPPVIINGVEASIPDPGDVPVIDPFPGLDDTRLPSTIFRLRLERPKPVSIIVFRRNSIATNGDETMCVIEGLGNNGRPSSRIASLRIGKQESTDNGTKYHELFVSDGRAWRVDWHVNGGGSGLDHHGASNSEKEFNIILTRPEDSS